MWTFLRRRTLTQWILVGMVLGTLLGWAAPDVAVTLRPLATVFLRMIKSIIVPLIFGTLVVGIAGHGDDMKRVGWLALKAIVYFEVVTTLALAVGLVMVNLVRPGAGVVLPTSGAVATLPAPGGGGGGERLTLAGVLERLVPQSFFEAATQNEVLQIVFWAVLFALALTLVRGRSKEVLLGVCEAVAEVMFKFTGLVMRFAPIGVGAAIAFTVASSGLDVLKRLGRFVRAVKEPALIAFSTASSEAALPTAMEHMEAIGVPRRIVAFVMPTGYSFNLDGSTLYLAVAAVDVAQAAGVALNLSQQLLMMLTLMVASKGLAGVPRAAIVILAATLASFHLPAEAIGVLLGVDVLMDMARTSVNLVGNCLATVVMARWEGEYDVPADREGVRS